VEHVNRSALQLDSPHERSAPAGNRILLNVISEFLGSSEVCSPPMDLAVKPQNETGVRATEPSSVFDESFKHRLEIECRAAYDFQNFAGRGLLFQCLGEVTVPDLQLFEQPHILDGNHCLIGKSFEEGDLFF